MLRATLLHLNKNTAITALVPALGPKIAIAENKLADAGKLVPVVVGPTTGITRNTRIVRSRMITLALKCGDALSAYASSVGNNDLRLKVTFTARKLYKMKIATVGNICEGIHNAALENLAVAGDFGYNAADLADLQDAISLYRSAVSNPRIATVRKSWAVSTVDNTVREVIDLFRTQIDKMVKTLKASHPDFVSHYFASRQVIDLGHSFTKIRGIVKDENDVPLIGVTFIVRKVGTREVLWQAVSQVKGIFRIPKVTPGNYDFTWTFTGYQTITESNVHISPGKELRRRITMKKEIYHTINPPLNNAAVPSSPPPPYLPKAA